MVAWLSSEQTEAIRDAQKARIISDLRRLDQLQRQACTYNQKIEQAKLYEAQAETDAPSQVKQAEANLAAVRLIWSALGSRAKASPSRCKTVRTPYQDRRSRGSDRQNSMRPEEDIAHASADASRKEVAAAEASLQQSRAQMQNIPIKAADRLTLLAASR